MTVYKPNIYTQWEQHLNANVSITVRANTKLLRRCVTCNYFLSLKWKLAFSFYIYETSWNMLFNSCKEKNRDLCLRWTTSGLVPTTWATEHFSCEGPTKNRMSLLGWEKTEQSMWSAAVREGISSRDCGDKEWRILWVLNEGLAKGFICPSTRSHKLSFLEPELFCSKPNLVWQQQTWLDWGRGSELYWLGCPHPSEIYPPNWDSWGHSLER
jgi:hypothetical protein